MGKITITEKQEAIIRRLNDPLYTVEFLKEWVNRNDNVFINAPAALQAMGASGFFAAVRAIERAKESDGKIHELSTESCSLPPENGRQEHSTNPGGMQRARLDLPGL